MPNNVLDLYNRQNPRGVRTGVPTFEPADDRQFATGVPGFDELSGIASGNTKNLLLGEENPGIVRNMNAEWGAASGLAPGSEFLRNRAVDLYGQRGESRKAQGMKDLLAMLQGYSGTVVASPGQVLGSEANAQQNALNQARLQEDQYQFDERMALENGLNGGRGFNRGNPSSAWRRLYASGGNGFLGPWSPA